MNHCVPDFEIHMDEDDEYPLHISKKPSSGQNDEIMELLWQNGEVVMQSQNQRPFRKPPLPPSANNTGDVVNPMREIRSSQPENYSNQHLFMQEDEMVSWLQDSTDEDPPFHRHDFCTDMLFPPLAVSSSQNYRGAVQAPVRPVELRQQLRPPAPKPPIPPTRRPEQVANTKQNFAHFSKHGNVRMDEQPSSSSKTAAARESTVVDSCDTPNVTMKVAAASASASKLSETIRSSTVNSSGGKEATTFNMTVTSSPGGSSESAEPVQREPVVDRKRKGREPEESEFQSEDVDFESLETKKQGRGSASIKRTRAAEVHNLSERKRRDRINEKMRALQELIPRCNKSDKASMLDEAIEYLKSLQLQVQMMSMGCGMVPMMFPRIQQYMPGMGMGMGMGMGIEMGMGMNRPVMPFPNMLANSALPAAATAAAHLGPRFAMPPFNMPHVPATTDSSRMQAANQSDNLHNSLGSSTLAPDQSLMGNPNSTDPYQQYLSPHQMQLKLMQAMNQPNFSKPNTSGGQENPQKH